MSTKTALQLSHNETQVVYFLYGPRTSHQITDSANMAHLPSDKETTSNADRGGTTSPGS